MAWPFFGIWMKIDFFQSCGHYWVFPICWHIECSTFIALSFRIWNSSNGIPSPPLTLLIVMLPKAHFTSNFRMSGSRWGITPLWLSGSSRSFLYSSSVFLPPLLNIFCFCLVHTISVLYRAHLCENWTQAHPNFSCLCFCSLRIHTEDSRGLRCGYTTIRGHPLLDLGVYEALPTHFNKPPALVTC